MNVWTYWGCKSCGSIVSGKVRSCPNCGAPIPNDVKYMMPDDGRVAKAKAEGKVFDFGDIFEDENGIKSEAVSKGEERTAPNWECDYCGYQNFAEDEYCKGCGHPKDENTKDYFGNFVLKKGSDVPDKTPDEKTKNFGTLENEYNQNSGEINDKKTKRKNIFSLLWRKIKDFYKYNGEYFAVTCGFVLGIILVAVIFTPVKKTSTVTGFRWERAVEVEKFALCHDSGWSVPSGGTVTDKDYRIHHYDHVIDHYETKSRVVTEQVFDGYDTHYSDLGNGQASVSQTPRYRTETHTEYYQEPVYRDDPVYKWYYYYDIDRWIHEDWLKTSGSDHSPYWYETDIPEDVDSPIYDDLRLGERKETYKVLIKNSKGDTSSFEKSENEWASYEKGDKLTYWAFKFSDSPLSEITVE